MKWEILPLRSVGPIAFGMPRADVRRALGVTFREFTKSPDRTSNKVDAFEGLLVHTHYEGTSGRCELVEFGGGTAHPTLNGIDLLEESFAALRDLFHSLDPDTKEDASGLESAVLGIGVYAPNADDDDKRAPEGVSVFAGFRRQAS